MTDRLAMIVWTIGMSTETLVRLSSSLVPALITAPTTAVLPLGARDAPGRSAVSTQDPAWQDPREMNGHLERFEGEDPPSMPARVRR